MKVSEFIRKYGTYSVPYLLRQIGEGCNIAPTSVKLLLEIANDLQATLEDYASQDHEEPTVGNKVM